jgi:hypothetical protein
MAETTYKSPDGLLTLIVRQIEPNDWVIGFDGFPWHTHPDQLLGIYGDTAKSALENFVSAILNNREIILVSRSAGGIVEAFISDNLELSLGYLRSREEEFELRYWDGSPASVG